MILFLKHHKIIHKIYFIFVPYKTLKYICLGKILMCFSFTHTHKMLLMPDMWNFLPPTPNNSLQHQLCILQFNSNTNQSQCRPHRLRVQSHNTAPPLQITTEMNRSPGYPQLLFDSATKRSFPRPPPWILSFARYSSQNSGKHVLTFTSLLYNKG